MWLFIPNSTVQPRRSQLTKSSPWLAQVSSEAAQLSPSPHHSHPRSWLNATFFVFLLHQRSPEWRCSLAPSWSLLPFSKSSISNYSLGLSYSREHWHDYQSVLSASVEVLQVLFGITRCFWDAQELILVKKDRKRNVFVWTVMGETKT